MRFTKVVLTIIIFLSALFSCGVDKSIRRTIAKNIDGLVLVENKKIKISIKYYEDYWFHKLNKKFTLNWNKDFVKSIYQNSNKKILFTAHTTIEPYCSTIGLLYKNNNIEMMVQNNAEYLRKKLNAKNIISTTKIIGMIRYIKLSYILNSSKLRTDSKYVEYYSVQGENILRIIFWTIEANDNWFESETKGIIETVKSRAF